MNCLPDPKLLDGMKEVVKDSEQVGDREALQPADLELLRGNTEHNSRSVTVKSHFLPAAGLPQYPISWLRRSGSCNLWIWRNFYPAIKQ